MFSLPYETHYCTDGLRTSRYLAQADREGYGFRFTSANRLFSFRESLRKVDVIHGLFFGLKVIVRSGMKGCTAAVNKVSQTAHA